MLHQILKKCFGNVGKITRKIIAEILLEIWARVLEEAQIILPANILETPESFSKKNIWEIS